MRAFFYPSLKSIMVWMFIIYGIVIGSVHAQTADKGCTALACVVAGPRLVSIDSQQSVILNSTFNALLPGSNVNATVADWNALATPNVSVNALITQISANTGIPTSQVLTTNITLSQLQLATAQVLRADGQPTTANALESILLSLGGGIQTIQLFDLLKTDFGNGTANSSTVNVLDLLTGSVQLFNYNNVATTGPTPIVLDTAALGLTGLSKVTLQLQVVEPPVLACGGVNTEFYTAAVRAKIHVELNSNAINTVALKAALSGIATNVSVTSTPLALDIYIDAARAQGQITAVNKLTNSVTIQANSGITNAYIGTIADNVFFNRNSTINGGIVSASEIARLSTNFTIAGLANVKTEQSITVRAVAEGSSSPNQTLTFTGAYPQTQTITTGAVGVFNLLNTLLSNLTVQVVNDPSKTSATSLLGISIPINAAISNVINNVMGILNTNTIPLVRAIVQNTSTILTPTLDNLLKALGIAIGQGVFTVQGVSQTCSAVLTLVKTLIPTTDTGLFNLVVQQGVSTILNTPNVGNGGTTNEALLTPGLIYNLSETAGTATVLTDYNTTYECKDQNNLIIKNGTGTSFTLTAPAFSSNPMIITCEFINADANNLLSADLSITKINLNTTYTPGETATYQITVNNAGPDNVVGAIISDILPRGVTLNTPWSCTITAGTGACPVTSGGVAGDSNIMVNINLDNGGTAVISIPVRFSSNQSDY